MVDATRRGFLKASVSSAGAAAVAGGAEGCAHHSLPVHKGSSAPAEPPADTVDVDTTVNGTPHQLRVGADDSTLDVVRNEVGLTGCKLACGHGACGACTMQLDGVPVTTCLLPATALHGRKVTTVEGLATDESLHPIQRAFMGEDALQCGYCTPGFVVEAAAFVDEWRAKHGSRPPDRDTIAAALAGHLCRCGAYDQIYAAVRKACAGAYDGPPRMPARYEARAKVTGAAKYTTDIQLPGQLFALSLHAPMANARITRLDWSAALAMPGVHGLVDVLDGQRKIRFGGQEIVAVAADDERTAREAIARIEIEYAPLGVALGIKGAVAPDAPVVYPRRRDRKKPPNASEGPLIPEPWQGNLRGPLALFSKRKKAANRAIDEAATEGTLAEGVISTQAQCHTCLEPHAVVAHWEGERLTVYLSTQAVTAMRRDIAEHFGLDKEQVRVIAEYVGGGFGSKATLTTETLIAIELARVTGKPVRYVLDRRPEIAIGGYRPATEIDIKLAADADGNMTGLRALTRSDAGVAVGHAVGVMMRLIYPEAPRELSDYDVLTHVAPGKPFRGPGGPQACFALEQMIDEVARKRGEDPIALRRRWDPNKDRNRLYDWAEALPVWEERDVHGADRGRYRRGVGLASGVWLALTEPKSRVSLTIESGKIVARQATQDMGNGTRTVLANAIATELRLEPHEVDVRIGDSDHPHGPLSGGSRCTASIVPTCIHACNRLKDALVGAATQRRGLQDAVVGDAGIEHRTGTVLWRDAIADANGLSVTGRRRKDEQGYFLPPLYNVAAERAVTASVVVTQVEVDTRLGRLRVLETWGGYAVGRIVSPTLARSQATGGIVQAISYALYEERRLDPTAGYLLTGGLEDYRIIGIGDVGPINVHFDQKGFEQIRGRSAGLGEVVTVSPPAAIANAVYHATGWRPTELPIRPDRALKGLGR